MSLATVERSPRFYARLAGVIYLSAMGLSIASQMFILGRLVQDDPRATANNILASEGLLLKSAFVPKLLAGWGVFASLVLAIGSLMVIVSPTFAASASMIYMVPMFFYEVPLGLWFLIKGVAVVEKR